MGSMKSLWDNYLRRQSILAAKILLLAGSLAVVAALSAYITVKTTLSGREVKIPDLTEMSVADATQLLVERGLILEESGRRYDARVEEGKILAQDPPPDSSIKLQRKVKIVVSLGDKVTAIPDLRGGAARRAQITLQQQGMTVAGQVYTFSQREEENLVIGQDPLPGEVGPREGKVGLLISRGRRPRTYVMPDLIAQPEATAVEFLRRAGLRPAPVRRSVSRYYRPGSVMAQRPEAGFRVRSGDLVVLTVAREAGGNDE
jgi:serine/threonine-protein kinase